ncbi:hypothetical protein CK203_044588 [Vitis vinifera]|uniref:Uncharacterized protein n=1 Tax=Vitis vinifera TaxID=29760 RepID=A0A438HJP6_VITVI|nr:hypothetical protein CK203_044588 [Vitis vinifera]
MGVRNFRTPEGGVRVSHTIRTPFAHLEQLSSKAISSSFQLQIVHAEVKVDRPFHYSPSASQWSGGTTNSNNIDTFKVNGHRLKPFMEHSIKTRRKSTSMSHRNPNQKGSVISKGIPEDLRMKHSPLCTSGHPFSSFYTSAMAKTRGAKTPSPSTRNRAPRVSPVQNSMTEPSQPPAIPPSVDGAPSSPL